MSNRSFVFASLAIVSLAPAALSQDAMSRAEEVLARLPKDDSLIGKRVFKEKIQNMIDGQGELVVTRAEAKSGAAYRIELRDRFEMMGMEGRSDQTWWVDERFALIRHSASMKRLEEGKVRRHLMKSARRGPEGWNLKIEGQPRPWSRKLAADQPRYSPEVLLLVLGPHFAKAGSGEYAVRQLAFSNEAPDLVTLRVEASQTIELRGKRRDAIKLSLGRLTGWVVEGELVRIEGGKEVRTFLTEAEAEAFAKAAKRKPPAGALAAIAEFSEVASGKKPVTALDPVCDWKAIHADASKTNPAAAKLSQEEFARRCREELKKAASPQNGAEFERVFKMKPTLSDTEVRYGMGDELVFFVLRKQGETWRFVRVMPFTESIR